MAIPLEVPALECVGVWNRTLLASLIQSGFFEVRYADFPMFRLGRRWRCLNLLRVNGHLVLLDTWDRSVTLGQFLRAGVFREALANVKLVLRINKRADDLFVKQFFSETGIPVSAWTMFPDSQFPLEQFSWRPAGHEWQANLTGCNRRCGRGRWVKSAQKLGGFYIASERESHAQYALSLQNCRWGVCLNGMGDKTRREPEFASCGMPLALNYRPHYPFRFEPGLDFLFLETPADLVRLNDTDPAPFAARSRALWAERFSPRGMASTLLELVAEFCERLPSGLR